MLCYIAAASFARFRSMASAFFLLFLFLFLFLSSFLLTYTDEKTKKKHFSNSPDSQKAGRLLRASGHLFLFLYIFFLFLLFQSVTFVRSPRDVLAAIPGRCACSL
jgi:hypothetical protein